jgi:hypothetical protein
MEDLRALAMKLEETFQKAHAKLLSALALEPDTLLETLSGIQAKALGFDEHEVRRFQEALEEKRVKTLSQGNVFMTCVLSSAVALSEFKKLPKAASAGFFRRRLEAFKGQSTNGLSLSVFAFSSFYALLGRGAIKRLAARRQKSTIPLK